MSLMDVELKPGKYVVAVSGGVDSMALLYALVQQSLVVSHQSLGKVDGRRATDDSSRSRLVVAHFDHGIRPDSEQDREFVQEQARKYGLPFVHEEGKLGPDASEAHARDVRYLFLRRAQKGQGAQAIITAHHQDDVLETAVLNLLRGTGRKGLSSLKSHDDMVRPLLNTPKQDLIAYARQHNIAWREDPTNVDERYLRNYIRRRIMPRFASRARQQLLARIEKAHRLNEEIDALLDNLLQAQPGTNQLQRRWFAALPYAVSCEVMAAFLRHNGISGFTRGRIERLVVAAKTKPPGKLADVDADYVLHVGKNTLRFIAREASKKQANNV